MSETYTPTLADAFGLSSLLAEALDALTERLDEQDEVIAGLLTELDDLQQDRSKAGRVG